ncbi:MULTISPECIES: type II toxin-antitoxin system RelE/ParE family toxin [Stenotrophomonas]|uniref:type II toxin-antitoxin system RelE/ParE family toxin n=1 Tax=Stenotrophomonas TaxID=40323 RepID=UPI000F837311|nr:MULTISPECIES: type II toxin-antitoxin system RelE/ParE family toxin [Stenotrophomonas]MCU1042097.1 type II toxin-antitoxin system RelE/ParE family toxin [Stenotrophomonas maltophilia]RTY14795.1 type II toxin-antitoxin system RelE/ParE family toxin [Stenotrophomonas geniculata]HDS0943446.1 type II toxin-antitoxin system RelE/ParE family toxin [Stenotrophomonas maltophilia]HDS0952566.1 type II toxin-antitoxin system RelE/ParE family toxin [Stenotrophomonas maltophilia]HDS1000670.1 type II tox
MKSHKSTDSEAQQQKRPREVIFLGQTLKDYKDLPAHIHDPFGFALTAVQYDQTPTLRLKHLNVSRGSAIELIINGRPAYRLVYTTKEPGKVHILYAGKKTAQGTDRALIDTVEARLKQI